MLAKKRIEITGEEEKNSLPKKHEKRMKQTLQKQVKKMPKVRKMGGGKETEKRHFFFGGGGSNGERSLWGPVLS